MENANLCFSTYERPWRTARHKCTHFNIINIIWLPLYHPHSRGFYLPVAAGRERENHFHSIRQGRQPRMMAGGTSGTRPHASPPPPSWDWQTGVEHDWATCQKALSHLMCSLPTGEKPEPGPVWAMCIPCPVRPAWAWSFTCPPKSRLWAEGHLLNSHGSASRWPGDVKIGVSKLQREQGHSPLRVLPPSTPSSILLVSTAFYIHLAL